VAQLSTEQTVPIELYLVSNILLLMIMAFLGFLKDKGDCAK
jgi:hypothetical protein